MARQGSLVPVIDANSGYYLIKSKLNGNVIDILGGSTANGTGLDSWPANGPNGSANQLWELVPVSSETAGEGRRVQ
jgi:hypothetical protein